jgi:DNA-directed RNA polymerase specialized sigma24 family protein
MDSTGSRMGQAHQAPEVAEQHSRFPRKTIDPDAFLVEITANAAYQKLRGRRRGLPNPEIAQMLHANLGTVKSRVHRARLFLRGRLANYMGAGLEPSRS